MVTVLNKKLTGDGYLKKRGGIETH